MVKNNMIENDFSISTKCFVVGCSRSGTTLLSVLIDRHSKIAMTPETAFYEEISPKICSVDKNELRNTLTNWSRLPELGLDIETIIEHCNDQFTQKDVLNIILKLYSSKFEKPYCGEKTPGHWRFLDSIIADFPQTKIIFIVRDGRDTVMSLNKMPWWRYDINHATNVWIGAAEAACKYLQLYPFKVMFIRYEDLVIKTEETLTNVMEFIKLKYEVKQLDYQVKSNVVLHRSIEWKGKALSAIDDKRIGHWKKSATIEESIFLNKSMKTYLTYFGYI